ncbi:amidohydrolase family protein [Oceanobacillus salinisoli]|uniref:amidohydrolase family protein n=1 Tax=Oceanobacillus salinisoli TaxID=2678611 RepID=UPI0018CC6533|nr:amidohydrolase family protein [Oceanobacillus salinisoli]
MNHIYMIRAKKLVTVSDVGTIDDGAMVIKDGKIQSVGTWQQLRNQHPTIEVKDYSNYALTPSFVDCHTHLLEFAPSSLYPITNETQALAGKSLLLKALTSGITALGEQVCGHPKSTFSIDDYRKIVKDIPMHVSFAATSISIGFEKLAHFTAITMAKPVKQTDLVDNHIVNELSVQSEYPGENLFINATPANFTKDAVPRSGEIIYTFNELKHIVDRFHKQGKQIGVHVAGEEAIQMTLRAGVDVLHHAHGMMNKQMKQAKAQGTKIVATPMGGTHIEPNSPENILELVNNDIEVSIATDAYLPPFPNVSWLPFSNQSLQGPDVLMKIAEPAMKLLVKNGYNENQVLALITKNPAAILGKEDRFGKLDRGMDANFLIADGIPGIDINDVEDIKVVYFRGKEVVSRMN